MSNESSTHWLVRALLSAGAERGLTSRNAIAAAAGLDRGFLTKVERRGADAEINSGSLQKLAEAVGMTPETLLALKEARHATRKKIGHTASRDHEDSHSIPIMGAASGAAISSFRMTDGPIGYVPCPPALIDVPGAYALYIRNDSMSPMHSAGDLRFIHPHRPPRIGDSVIIQLKDGTGEREAYIKILERSTATHVVARQLNPPAEIKFSHTSVYAVHKVLTVNELFDA